MILAIDFDGVIHDYKHPIKRMGPPMPDALGLLQELEGHTIIIHTVKANTPSGKKAVKDWLDFFDVEYSEIVGKPDADFYIDDRSVKSLKDMLELI